MEKEIYYYIRIEEYGPKIDTEISRFDSYYIGKILKITPDYKIFFELKDHPDSLIILPIFYIKWMVPVKKVDYEKDALRRR